MSVFSDKLHALVQSRMDKGQITMYSLAKNSNIDRSSLYKFINGERMPANMEVLGRLMEALRLSPAQTRELRAAYDISRMGEESYLRRRNTIEFLNAFGQYEDVQTVKPMPLPDPPPLPPEGAEVCRGILSVNNLVQAAVVAEAARPNGKIQIIAQPEYDFLVHTLSSLTLGRSCAIQHVICLESETPEGDNRYNLDCLRAVVELMFSNYDYKPYYYYDSITSHFKNSNSLPYLIVTSECALQLSYDRKYAVCLRGSSYVDFFHKLFEDACGRSQLMISNMGTAFENIHFYRDIQSRTAPPRWDCCCEPCFSNLADREMLEKYVYDIPHREELIQSFLDFVAQKRLIPPHKYPYVSYFTEAGLDRFCQTGRLWQFPASAYAPLEPRDRWELLRRCCESKCSHVVQRMLHNGLVRLSVRLEVIDFWDGHIAFIYERAPDQFTHLFLYEKSLSNCFEDLFSHIDESDLAYSEEETKAIFRQKMKELEKQF